VEAEAEDCGSLWRLRHRREPLQQLHRGRYCFLGLAKFFQCYSHRPLLLHFCGINNTSPTLQLTTDCGANKGSRFNKWFGLAVIHGSTLDNGGAFWRCSLNCAMYITLS
jgi:hypothetical protein